MKIENSVIELFKNGVEKVFSGDQNLAFWDAQLKILVCQILESFGVKFIQFVHDVDYLSKVRNRKVKELDSDNDGFAVVPHNGTYSKDLWCAAFEITSFLGGEVFLDLQELAKAQFPVKTFEKNDPEFLDKITEAFGWRGIVNTGKNNLIAGEINPRKLKDEVEQLVNFAIKSSKELTANPEIFNFEPLKKALEEILKDGEKLSNVYLDTFLKSVELMFSRIPSNLELTKSSQIFVFNTKTCNLKRFKVLELLMNKKTREILVSCYNETVKDTGILGLEKFGDNALPFDVLIPGLGRGTLRLTQYEIIVDFGFRERPIVINRAKVDFEINSIEALAKAIEEKFGENTCIIGKAITLPLMILQEAPIVLNEKGSSYFYLVHKLKEKLEKSGIKLKLFPVIRLKVNFLDSLSKIDKEIVINLPQHIKFFLKKDSILLKELGEIWKTVSSQAKELYQELLETRSAQKIANLITRVSGNEELKEIEKRIQEIREIFADPSKRERLSQEENQKLREELKDLEYKTQKEKLKILGYCKRVEALELFNYRPPWWCPMMLSKDWLELIKENSEVYLEEF